MPRFFKDMPSPAKGRWMACVLFTSPYRSPIEKWTIPVNGLRRAYIAARLMALWKDITTNDQSGLIGIEWAVRKLA